MTDTLIVSDLHLDPSEPSRYEAALDAISQCPVDRLILAGDIFEAWVGDDGATDLDQSLLTDLGQKAESVWFIPGNRDFLVSADYLSQFSIQRTEFLVFDRVLVVHGDELCTADTDYQAFKAEVRAPAWQKEFLEKPLAERQAIAEGLRKASRETQANRPEAIGDVVVEAVDQAMAEHQVDALVHGHTHRPQIHAGPLGLRAVTSDWGLQGIGVWVRSDPLDNLEIRSVELGPGTVRRLDVWSRQAGTPEWNRNSLS